MTESMLLPDSEDSYSTCQSISDEIDNYFTDKDKEDNSNSSSDVKQDQDDEIVVGIDLGTTNSCVAIWRNNNLEIIPNTYGHRTIPSVVAFTNKTKYVGYEAKNQIDLNPENTYYEVKRLIGRKIDDNSVVNDKPFLTYGISGDKQKNVILTSELTNRKKKITPEEISSYILMELKYMAEDYLKQPVEKAVITVPAYFNDSQRQATKDAAIIAGLDCVRIINEPTAAALSYGLERLSKNKEEDINVIVYDCGGGTLDVSLLNISNGVFEVLASTGNTHLGGADFDNALINYCKNYFKKKNGIKQLKNLSLVSLQKLKKACENAKKMLSETWKATIAVKNFYQDKSLLVQITRKQFEKLCRDLFILCLKPVEDVLKSCDMDRDNIDEIILVGGATRMPTIRENLKLFFRGKEPNCTINPDEVVAAGAAIQGYIISHKSDPFAESVVLLDVIPLSLGVETIGGLMTTLIPRNSVIPIKRKKKFTTDSDYETSVVVKIFEGEREMTKDNFKVGEFTLKGLESAPRGIAEINITFSIDINGIISVTAEDLKNNENKNSITITGNKGRLTPEEIKKLVQEAKDSEKKDKMDRKKRQLYYNIEDLCSNITINLENDEFKLKEKDKELILADINKIYKWLEKKNYLQRSSKEYSKVINNIQKKYGTLILKSKTGKDDGKVKSYTDDTAGGTTIYGNDGEDEEQIYEELENEELGITDEMGQEEKEEIRKLRNSLVELCHSVFEVINSDTINAKEELIREVRDYIDDVLLWIHVKEKISRIEYKQKLEEVNKTCDKLVDENKGDIFEKNSILQEIKTKRNELEQLCFAIKSSLMSNIFSLHEEQIKKLDDKICEVFDWLINIDVRKRKAEINNEGFNITEKDFQIRIDEVNDLCNDLYKNMVGINLSGMSKDIINDDVIKTPGQGTTLDSLRDMENNQN